MKRVLRPFYCIGVVAVVAAVACHAEETTESSTPASIATDLPDDGADGTVRLYWVLDSMIMRGRCADREVLLRSTCVADMQSMDYGLFKQRLDGGLSDTIRELSAEAQRIQVAVGRIEAEIRETLEAMAEIEASSGPLSQELERLRAEIRRFEAIIAEYNEELRQIDEALSELIDQDLRELRLLVLSRISDFQERVAGISREIPAILEQIRGIEARVAELQDHLDVLNVRLSNLNQEAVLVSSRLQAAYDDFSVYEETLDYLEAGFVRPVLRDNEWFQKVRLFVRRFDRVFEDA